MTGAHTMANSASVEGTFRLGDVFSKSFGVFGRHVVAFFLLALLANIPPLVLALAAPTRRALTPTSAVFFAPTSGWFGLLGVLVAVICWTIANGAVFYGVVQDLRGGTVAIAQALAIAARRFLPMVGVAIALGFLSMMALLLLVVPGIIVFCMYYVAAPVCIAERIGVGRSLSRSRFLTKGHRWQIFGALALIVIVEAIASFAITMSVIFLIGLPVGATTLSVVQIASFAISAIFRAFNAVVAGVFYYQLRVAKDGVDLAKIASVFD
jgi:hypothetical protein